MADKKISQLDAATTPLAGTEVLPIVQSSTTKKVAVSDLTAGRAISATQVTLSTGNLIVGAAGQGVDFSANTGTAGMTSELLNWYEEGTFTPTVRGTSTVGTATYTTQSGTYTRIGRMVYFQLELSWNSGTGTGQMRLGGLPFTCGNSNCAVSIGDVENVALTAGYYMAGAYVFANSTQISLRECQVGGGGNNPVTYDAAGIIRVGGCYYV
jgi:hypothetical protein